MTSSAASPWYEFIDVPEMVDPRGALWALEFDRVPFPVQRLFWVTATDPSIIRGEHAHRQCHQLLIALSGEVTVEVTDSERSETLVLDNPNRGLHVPPMLWATERGFSNDAVLGVLASHPWEDADYIRDFSTYTDLMP